MTDGWVLNQAHRYRLNETERVERNKKKTELVREQVEYDTRAHETDGRKKNPSGFES